MIVSKLIGRLRNWQRDREAINVLLSCSDKQLNDIGVHRADVVEAVKGRLRADAT